MSVNSQIEMNLSLQSKDIELQNGYKKQESTICYLQEAHFRFKDTHRLKLKGWKNISHVNGSQEKARVPILISENIDF